MKTMCTPSEVIDIINTGKTLLLAGDESLFTNLPRGNWIGGSIPYFMGDNGGMVTKDHFMVNVLPNECKVSLIKQYDKESLESITNDYPDNGISFIVIPALSEAHAKFANEITQYNKLFNSPLIGWISGVHLNDLGKVSPKIFNGQTGESSTTDAIVMHTELPDGVFAKSDILNLFIQGDGDSIEFDSEGFSVGNAIVNGESVNFAEYLTKNKINLELPLVANYSGAMVNVSFQEVNPDAKTVTFYAPVFKGITYKVAKAVGDYEKQFREEIVKRNVEPIFSCNCILNYLYAGLEGKKTGEIKGPITFGEIAYMLLNQTLVYVTLEKK